MHTTKNGLLLSQPSTTGFPANLSFSVSSPLPHDAVGRSAPEAQPPRAEP